MDIAASAPRPSSWICAIFGGLHRSGFGTITRVSRRIRYNIERWELESLRRGRSEGRQMHLLRRLLSRKNHQMETQVRALLYLSDDTELAEDTMVVDGQSA